MSDKKLSGNQTQSHRMFQRVPIISETSVPAIPKVAKTVASGIRNNLGEIIIRRAARKTAMALPGDAICGWQTDCRSCSIRYLVLLHPWRTISSSASPVMS